MTLLDPVLQARVRRRAQIAVALLAITWLYTTLHTSDPEVEILGRYSSRFFAALLAYLAFTVAAAFVAATPVLLRIVGWFARSPLLTVTAAITLGGLLWAFLPMQPVAKLYPSVALLLFVWLLLDVAPLPPLPNTKFIWLLLALLGVGLGIELITLLYLPAGHSYDEGVYANVAMSFLRTGRLPGDFLGYPPRHFIGFGSWLVTLGRWFDVFGFGWWPGRLYAFMASVLAVIGVYFAGAELYKRRAGAAAAAFMGLSSTFVETHSVRPDAPMALMVAAGLWAYLYARRRPRPRNYFLHGFLVTLSLEAHLLGLAFWGTYAALYGLIWLRACRAERRLHIPTAIVWFVAGSLIPAAIFFVTHLLPDWGLPRAIILGDRQITLIGSIYKEANRWLEYATTYPLEAMLVVWAIVYALRSRQLIVLRVAATLALAYVVIAPTDWPQYTRYFLPVAAVLVGGMLADLKPALATAALVLLLGALIGDAYKVRLDVLRGAVQRPIPPVVEFVTANFPPGSTVVLDMSYYLYFADGHRYHYVQPGIHPPTISRLGGPPEDRVWASLKPDIVVLDAAKNEPSPWRDDYLSQMVVISLFRDSGIEIYVPPDSPLAAETLATEP